MRPDPNISTKEPRREEPSREAQSELGSPADQRIYKATEIATKIWWFAIFEIVLPLTISLPVYFIARSLGLGNVDATGLALISFIGLALVLFKQFDKYRARGLFQNTSNNLTIRIHLPWLLTLLSFLVAPSAMILGGFGNYSPWLPLAAFLILFNVVWYFFANNPIDHYDHQDKRFEHAVLLTSESALKIFTQIHHLVFFLAYVVIGTTLGLGMGSGAEWIPALCISLGFYGAELVYTQPVTKKIREQIRRDQSFLVNLLMFKYRVTRAGFGWIFAMIITGMWDFFLAGGGATLQFRGSSGFNLIVALFATLFLLASAFKVDTSLRMAFKIPLLTPEGTPITGETFIIRQEKFWRYNTLLTISILGLALSLALILNIPYVVFVSFPVLLPITTYENKKGFSSLKYNRYVFLIIFAGIIATFSFWTLPFGLNVNAIIFCILTLLGLEVFAEREKFQRESIRVSQNGLSILIFFFLAFIVKGFVFEPYVSFTSNPQVRLVANIVLNLLFVAVSSLCSFYLLFFTRFKRQTSRALKVALIVNQLILLSLLYVALIYRVTLILNGDLRLLVPWMTFYSLVFPLSLLLFCYLQVKQAIFSEEEAQRGYFYLSSVSYLQVLIWLSSMVVSISAQSPLIFTWIGAMGIGLYASVGVHYLLRFGLRIGKISDIAFQKFRRVNPYFLCADLELLLIPVFYLILGDLFFASLVATAVICVLMNVAQRLGSLIAPGFVEKLTIVTLLYFSAVIVLEAVVFFQETLFVITVPVIAGSASLYGILYYASWKGLIGTKKPAWMLATVTSVLGIGIALTPVVYQLELLQQGGPLNLLVLQITAMVSVMIFGGFFVLVSGVNVKTGILSREKAQGQSYWAFWLIFAASLALLGFVVLFFGLPPVGTFTGFMAIALYGTLTSFPLVKYGTKVGKLSTEIMAKYQRGTTYAVTLEFFLLALPLFSYVLGLEFFLSTFLATLVVTGLVNLIARKEQIFSHDFAHRLNLFTLCFLAVVASYYIWILLYPSSWAITLPITIASAIGVGVIQYGKRTETFGETQNTRRGSIIVSLGIIVSLALSPLVCYIDQIREGVSMQVLPLANSILFTIELFLLAVIACILLGRRTKRLTVEKYPALSQILFFGTIILFFAFLGTILLKPFDFFFSITLAALYFSLGTQLLVPWGAAQHRISREFAMKYTRFNPYAIAGELLLLFVACFQIVVPSLELFIAVFISTSLICILINVISYKSATTELMLFPKSFVSKFTTFTLLFLVSVVFYYIAVFLTPTFYVINIPVLIAVVILKVPVYYMRGKSLVSDVRSKKFLLGIFLVLSIAIILLPLVTGLDLYLRGGQPVDSWVILTISLFIIFTFTIFLSFIGIHLGLGPKSNLKLRYGALISWILAAISTEPMILSLTRGLLPIYWTLLLPLASLIVFTLNLYSVRLFVQIFEEKTREVKPTSLDALWNRGFLLFKNFVAVGWILSLAFIVGGTVSLITTHFPFNIEYLNVLVPLAGVFGTIFLLMAARIQVLKVDFRMVRAPAMLVSWIYINFTIALIFALYLAFLSIFNKIALFVVVIAVGAPLTLELIKNLRKTPVLSTRERIVRGTITAIFLGGLVGFLVENFLYFTSAIPFLEVFPAYQIVLLLTNITVLSHFTLQKYLQLEKEYTNEVMLGSHRSKYLLLNFAQVFGTIIILFFTLLYVNPTIGMLLFFLTAALSLRERGERVGSRSLHIGVLSFSFFFQFFIVVHTTIVSTPPARFPPGLFVLEFCLGLLVVLGISILLNSKSPNLFEIALLVSTLSVGTCVFIASFTSILLLYNLTISCQVFLFFFMIYLYRNEDARFKWASKSFILLLVFNIVSYISYRFLFIKPSFDFVNAMLTFTLTVSLTGATYIGLFNKGDKEFRDKTFLGVLAGLVCSIPIFVYFLLAYYMPIPIPFPIPLIVALNVAIFTFYLSVGIYQWRLSWAIWRFGWWAWNFLPLINAWVILQIFAGVDLQTNALQFGSILSIDGSIIFTVLVVTLLYVPVLWTKIRKYFTELFFFFWGESLLLLGWISTNVFAGNLLLSNLMFGVMALFLLMPLLYKLQWWRLLAPLWLALTVVNGLFFYGLVFASGGGVVLAVAIDCVIVGFLLVIYSWFPNIRNKWVWLIVAYSVMMGGIFFAIFFTFWKLTGHLPIALNLALIVVGFTLFSSKYIQKMDQDYARFIISLLIMVNTSLLTYFSLALVPSLATFGVFAAIAVLGGSIFVFNHYEMLTGVSDRLLQIDQRIPWAIMTFGIAAAMAALFLALFNSSIMILGAVFSGIVVIFLYRYLKHYQYLLWGLIPVPLAFLTQAGLEFLPLPSVFQSLVIFTWLFAYVLFFQVTIIVAHRLVEQGKILLQHEVYEVLINERVKIWANGCCFLANSFNAAVIGTILLKNSWILQWVHAILLFLVVWSILSLLSFRYIRENGGNLHSLDKTLHFISLVPSIALGILLGLLISPVLLAGGSQPFEVGLFVAWLLGGITFLMVFLDRFGFQFLHTRGRAQILLGSWLIFINCLMGYLHLFHNNVFLLILSIALGNLPATKLLENFDSKYAPLANRIQFYLVTSIVVLFSLNAANWVTIGFLLAFPSWPFIVTIALFGTLFFTSLFILNYFFNWTLIHEIKNKVGAIAYLATMVFLAGFVISLLDYYGILLLATGTLVLLGETFLGFYLIHYYDSQQRLKFIRQYSRVREAQDGIVYPNPHIISPKLSPFLSLGVYLELSLLAFALTYSWTGILEAFLISQGVLLGLSVIEMYFLKQIGGEQQKFAWLMHTVSYLSLSIFAFIVIVQYITNSLAFLGLGLLVLVGLQFYTNRVVTRTIAKFLPQKESSLKDIEEKIQDVIGIVFYGVAAFTIQLLIAAWFIPLQVLILCGVVHGFMLIDQKGPRFLIESNSLWIKAGAWIGVIIGTIASLAVTIAFSAGILPLIVVIVLVEVAYLFHQVKNRDRVEKRKDSLRHAWLWCLYGTFVAWPIFFVTLDLVWNFLLVTFSAGIMFIMTRADERAGGITDERRKIIRKVSFLVLGALSSLTLFLYLQLNVFPVNLVFVLGLNASLAGLLFIAFLALFVKPFRDRAHSRESMLFWTIIFLLCASCVYFLSISVLASTLFLIVALLVYPFVFLLEEIRRAFGKLVAYLSTKWTHFKEWIQHAWTNIQAAIKRVYQSILGFLTRHFQAIWITISLGITLVIAWAVLVYLSQAWVVTVFSGAFIFVLLSYLIAPHRKTEDSGRAFTQKVVYYMILYVGGIGTILGFVPVNVLLILLAIIIFGAILLFYIYREEKQGKISIKWRFYTTIFFIGLLVLLAVLIYLQTQAIISIL